MFAIDPDEYEIERNIFDLWRWISEQHVAMKATGNFDREYFRQGNSIVKKMNEEMTPVAHLGLHLVDPMREVYVRCFVGNQNFDAQIRTTGFGGMAIKVEVTTTQSDETVYGRHQLADHGIVQYPVRFTETDQGKIRLPLEPVDANEQFEEWAKITIDRAAAKVNSDRYDIKTAVLVVVSTRRPLSLRERDELVTRAYSRMAGKLPNIYGLYFIYDHPYDLHWQIDQVREYA